MFCAHCGAADQSAAFCSKCGQATAVAPTVEPARAPQGSAMYPTTPPITKAPSTVNSTVGIVFGAIAFLFFPVIFGPIGIVLSIVAFARKERLAPVALAVSILGLLIGMLLGAMLYG